MPTVVAVFASSSEAARAKALLVDAGVAENAITLSADYAGDALAAEAPGQAYEYPPDVPEMRGERLRSVSIGVASRGSADAKWMADVQRGSCVLTVEPSSRLELPRLREILTRNGAVVVRAR